MKITLEPAALQENEVIIRGDTASPEIAALLQFLSKKNSGKVLLEKEDEQCPVDIRQIVFLETVEGKVSVYTPAESYQSRLKLYELKELLDGSFVQINKSTVVNIDFVRAIQAEFSGNYRLKLKGRKESLTLSRKYFKDFKDRI